MNISSHITRLTELGYFQYVPEKRLADAQASMHRSLAAGTTLEDAAEDSDLGRSLSWRQYAVDSENLCEGELGEYLMHCKEVLALEGVQLETVADEMRNDRNDYIVQVNGEEIIIYTERFPTEDCWGMSYIRLLVIMNTLLERAGSTTRAYGFGRGNDTHIFLLTPELFEYLQGLEGLGNELSVPYTVTWLLSHYLFSWNPLILHPEVGVDSLG